MAYVSASSSQLLPETSSRCVAEGVTSAHSFEVVNFSLLDGMGTGNFISSSTFSVGGCDWTIRLFPDGSAAQNSKGGAVSAFLCLQGGAAGTRVKFIMHLLGKGSQSWSSGYGAHAFASVGEECGWTNFVDKSRLRWLLFGNNNCFTVRCVLTVIKDPRMQNVVVPEPNLRQDFKRMMEEGKGKDVMVHVDNQLFWCHRCVLAARSPVFNAELFGPMKNAQSVEIHGMKNKCTGDQPIIVIGDMKADIFRALLHFLYTDSLPDHQCDDDKNAVMQHLLVAADRYGVDRLKLMCEEELCRSVDMQSVASTLAIAEQHQCVQLKDACVRLIVSPGVLGAIMKTDDFKHLAASCPSVIKEIEDKMGNTLRIQ
ncbi:hypothetical protein SETIT_7G245100v2 [Setaria italica]|uniref:BTB domain-containing protein n=1 Tax=Setaria italica TaxID=4555 RepID=K3YBP9_SETIT|nr:BTB/POZ and MATH domain-containing protein 1 [Setaria italica]RCV35507.1 hypothetical protein SETIT_7G245100v2 [Setaria italica]